MNDLAKQREYGFTDEHFNCLRDMVTQYSGIKLPDTKRDMVYGRLVRRLRCLNLDSFEEYCELVSGDSGEERVALINAITTNLTSFFREKHHFELLAGSVIPAVLQANADTRRIRIWSAGCSTGEEPYSIAMTVKEAMPRAVQWDIKILATDLDTNVLDTARSGIYPLERVSGLPEKRLKRWFRRGRGEQSDSVKVVNELQEIIRFRQLNLMETWPMRGPFDIIFCRNVVIYFDKETQKVLFDKIGNLMADDGHLFIGHSESLFKVTDRFTSLGQTAYRKCA
ncbi:MAG TPA: chemotaxis protein CheR [Acidiferrobacteraceae bacterium]|nr:chemotaxis protein CheR [Acidiferrobacteraceae bacterium]